MGYTAGSFTAGQQPTTAQWNVLWSNDSSFNDGTGIANNAINAAHLATNAITLGYAQITTNFTTTSSSATQITGITSAVTIPAGGRKVRIRVYMPQVNNSVGGNGVTMQIWDGTVGSGTVLQTSIITAPGNNYAFIGLIEAVVTPSAGSKTYNASLQTGGGTATVTCSSTQPAFILVEAI